MDVCVGRCVGKSLCKFFGDCIFFYCEIGSKVKG